MAQSNSYPLVSVIIPAYNQGPLLARAIESALGQTYHNLEIIVVNDGSTDPVTSETALRYGDRITYVERENGGVAAARNTGLLHATGDLVAWLDHDDVWLPEKLRVQVEVLQKHPEISLVHSSYYLIDAEGNRTGAAQLPEGEWKPLPKLLFDIEVAPCTALFPRRLMDETGPLDPTMNGSDDWDWCLSLALKGHRFYCIAEPLAEYRRHRFNTSRNPDAMVPAWLNMLDKFYARPGLPKEVLDIKPKAYFHPHAWATAVFYGQGRLPEAKEHLLAAARCYPHGVTRGRFLQSLVYSKDSQPTRQTVQQAIRFVRSALEANKVEGIDRRRLHANWRLVLALHAAGNRAQGLRDLGKAVAADPRLVADPDLWSYAVRAVTRLFLKIGGGRVTRRTSAGS